VPVLSVAAQSGGGSVSGLVICNDTNTPARGATVYLIPLASVLSQTHALDAKNISPSTSTDFSGAYEIESVQPGTYLISATMDGYPNEVQLALRRLEGLTGDEKEKLLAELPQVTAKAGADARKDIILRRAAAISGRVTVDIGGLPGRASVWVTRLRDEDSTGVPLHLDEHPDTFAEFAALDDRGMYRIAGLPEGRYRLAIHIRESHLGFKVENGKGLQSFPVSPGTGQLTVYAPEALDQADARVVDVKDGDEITDADISIPTRLLHSIGGIVMEGGVPSAGMEISFQRLGRPIEAHTAVSMPDGSFRFDLLPSGTYTLRAGSGEFTIQLQDTDISDATIDVHPTKTQTRK